MIEGCVGSSSRKKNAACYVSLRTYKPDGSPDTFEVGRAIGDQTKHRSDLIGTLLLLRCIKPEHRDKHVVIKVPNDSIARIVTQKANPQASKDVAEQIHNEMKSFGNIEVKSSSKYDKSYIRCCRLAVQTAIANK